MQETLIEHYVTLHGVVNWLPVDTWCFENVGDWTSPKTRSWTWFGGGRDALLFSLRWSGVTV